MPERNEITSNIDLLLDTLPSRIRELIAQAEHPQEDLLEIVLDLGRLPEARYRVTANLLGDAEVTLADIDAVTSAISAFGEDNRAGIPRTLQRSGFSLPLKVIDLSRREFGRLLLCTDFWSNKEPPSMPFPEASLIKFDKCWTNVTWHMAPSPAH